MEDRVCIMCGCSESNACYHDEYGNCCWVSDGNDWVCSHCAIPKEIGSVDRPGGTQNIDPLTPDLLVRFFKQFRFDVSVEIIDSKWQISLLEIDPRENPSWFDDWMFGVFLGLEKVGLHKFIFDPVHNIFNKEVQS